MSNPLLFQMSAQLMDIVTYDGFCFAASHPISAPRIAATGRLYPRNALTARHDVI